MIIAKENKARLIPLDPDGAPTGKELVVQFNPINYSNGLTMQWESHGQTQQWIKTDAGNLTLQLNFDSYEQGDDVTNQTEEFRSTLDPGQSNGAVLGCLFQWGKHKYKGIVSSIKEDYSMFLADGTPVRSVLTVVLKPWPEQQQ